MDIFLYSLAGALGVATALMHGYLGETRIIALATFPNTQARAFVRAIWQLSTATWVAGSLMIAAAPFLFADPAQRRLALFVAALPMIWGIVCNAWISKGRHFGWMALAAVLGLTLLASGLSDQRAKSADKINLSYSAKTPLHFPRPAHREGFESSEILEARGTAIGVTSPRRR